MKKQKLYLMKDGELKLANENAEWDGQESFLLLAESELKAVKTVIAYQSNQIPIKRHDYKNTKLLCLALEKGKTYDYGRRIKILRNIKLK